MSAASPKRQLSALRPMSAFNRPGHDTRPQLTTKKAIMPAGMAGLYQDWKLAPCSEIDGFIFLTGFFGTDLDGTTSPDAEVRV